MDNQGLISEQMVWDTPLAFKYVPWGQYNLVDYAWLEPAADLQKMDHRKMMSNLQSGVFKMWRLRPPAEGIAVTFPFEGRLFVYYLHGTGFFDTLNKENLLEVAKSEGLSGMMAETTSKGIKKILERFGFQVWKREDQTWCLELKDV